MKSYEAMFIFKPQYVDEKLEKEIKAVEKTIKTQGQGEVSYDNLGKRTLAYPIDKCDEGIYVNYRFSAQPSAIREINESMKHRVSILRSIIFAKGRHS